MDAIIPYLNFNGNASEALAFYSKVFDGKVIYQQSFGDAPMDIPPGYKDKVLHAMFQAGDLQFMVSDCMPNQPVTGGTNVSLSLNCPTVDDIEKKFSALAEGANITMALNDTFWGARFGMLTDKYGINWMFNHDYEKKHK